MSDAAPHLLEQDAALTPAELDVLLRAAEPAALLLPPRLLRRAIKNDRKLTGLGPEVPHRKSYVINREKLLNLADRGELGIEPERQLPSTLLLIERPEAEELASMKRGAALVNYWRLLFHCRVHLAIATSLKEHRLTRAAVRERIHRIGPAEFDEIRSVLRQEKLLLPPRNDRTAYEEFAATYLELSFFAAPVLPRYFSSIDDFGRIDRILADDVDAVALFAGTRLAGAPDPVFAVDGPEEMDRTSESGPAEKERDIGSPDAQRSSELLRRADKASGAGNVVRSAIWRIQAARLAPSPDIVAAAKSAARADLDRLAGRLQSALALPDDEAEQWRQILPQLVDRAAVGSWPPEARLLYDLQTACIDHERPVYSPDVIEWSYARFRGPLVRPLPNQPLVQAVKHLRRAGNRLPAIRLDEAGHHALSGVLHRARQHAENRLRERFRPIVRDTLATVSLRPHNLPERVARDKVIEEVIDQISERGHLSIGELRDALARNQLKIHDLAGPGEFFLGDPLIRANRELAGRAAGVYRRGPIYLRWLQRFSALAFGTRPGRWLTRFVALPFGGAFATVVMVQEILHLLHARHHLEPTPLAGVVGVLGVFYQFLLHVPPFRQRVVAALRLGWRALRAALYDVPAAVLRLRLVRLLLNSTVFLIFIRYVLKPAPAGMLVWTALTCSGLGPETAALGGAVSLLTISALLNSRLGRDVEEAAMDWLLRRWDYLSGFLPGLVRLVLDLFKSIVEAVDRGLYTVDEWFRFRTGQRRLTLVLKTLLGFFWFLVAYVVRLYVNVFIEPAVNPVKHFPAVTVAAKLLVPLWIPLTEFFAIPLMFLGRPLAYTIAFLNVHALPGAAGFLVWEFKSNWRLYRANRPRALQPVPIGHHGETMLRLLKPGFHSGPLPKLYAKLRRAERRAQRSGAWRSVHRLHDTLHHVEISIRRFAERELLALLNASRTWSAAPVQLAAVEAGSNRIRLELACPSLGEANLELSFEQQSGWLLVHFARPGWLPKLTPPQQATLTTALTGFCKLAGVDLIREQIEACFAPESPLYDVSEKGLVVWTGRGVESEVVYDLNEGPTLQPRVVEGRPPVRLPELERTQILFSSRPVSWESWVEAWERDQSGQTPEPLT